jgi:hypothetical protein
MEKRLHDDAFPSKSDVDDYSDEEGNESEE